MDVNVVCWTLESVSEKLNQIPGYFILVSLLMFIKCILLLFWKLCVFVFKHSQTPGYFILASLLMFIKYTHFYFGGLANVSSLLHIHRLSWSAIKTLNSEYEPLVRIIKMLYVQSNNSMFVLWICLPKTVIHDDIRWHWHL